MQIYKSAILKYLKSPSTWIPLLVSIVVVLGVGVIMPFVLIDLKRPDVASTYQIYAIVSVSTIASSSTLFSATFAAYKATQIYKQEIEEGTFLVLISKPISRRRIIFEKWLALITILLGYTAIVIIFYEVFILIFDPGYQIANLAMEPISKNIFIVGFILFFVILLLTILFSSIALLLSSKFSSASTIASVAGLGALIPVSGILPTFTLNNDYIVVSRNIGSTLIGKNPSEQTNDFLNQLPSLSSVKFTTTSLKNLFHELNKSATTINSSQEYANNIALYSGEKNIYSSVFFMDFYYQLNQISSIATDRLWANVDKYSLINSSNSSFSIRPDVAGKKVVVDNNIEINQIIEKFLKTIQEYQKTISDSNYLQNFYNVFNIIMKLKDIPGATVVQDETSYLSNAKLLIDSFWNKTENKFNHTLFNTFIYSPIINSIQNSLIVDPNIKNELTDRSKPYWYELRSLELVFLFKIFLDFKMSNQLLISSSMINNYYLKNNLVLFTAHQDNKGYYVLDAKAKNYFDTLMNSNSTRFNELINNYFKFDIGGMSFYSNHSIVDLLNLMQLKSSYGISIKSIKYEPYVKTWILIFIYSSVALLLVPISYYVIKKQNVR